MCTAVCKSIGPRRFWKWRFSEVLVGDREGRCRFPESCCEIPGFAAPPRARGAALSHQRAALSNAARSRKLAREQVGGASAAILACERATFEYHDPVRGLHLENVIGGWPDRRRLSGSLFGKSGRLSRTDGGQSICKPQYCIMQMQATLPVSTRPKHDLLSSATAT